MREVKCYVSQEADSKMEISKEFVCWGIPPRSTHVKSKERKVGLCRGRTKAVVQSLQRLQPIPQGALN